MDFSVKNLGGHKARYHEKSKKSPFQIVFVPGIFTPDIWEHQIRYFSKNFHVASFEPLEKGYDMQLEILEKILDGDEFKDVIIVSNGLGNSLAQELEYREEVVATVLTGARKRFRKIPRRLFETCRKVVRREPKIFKKFFFSRVSDYRVAKDFLERVELPDHGKYSTFRENYRFRKPVKNSLVIHPQQDSLSSIETARSFKPNASVSVIRSSGSFPFWEKPQEYNKAVLDFMSNLEGFVERREVSRTREKNRSLKEFEKPMRMER